MSRNRKHQSTAIRLMPAMKAAVLCAFLGGSAIGYVWQKNQIIDLGRKIKERELRLGQLQQANLKLSKQQMTLHSSFYLERRLKELNLNLVQPAQTQILRLRETVPGETEPRNGPLLAGPHAGPPPAGR